MTVDLLYRMKNSPLTIDDTLTVKGLAILMMIAYHLVGCPEKLTNIHAEWFGHPMTRAMVLCVPVYLFMSGYGLQCGGVMSLKRLAKRLGKLYTAFWWVAIPFVGIGILIGYYSLPSMDVLVMTALGLDYRFNDAWWFFCIYLGQLAAFLLIGRLRLGMYGYAILMGTVFVLTRIVLKHDIPLFILHMFLIYVNIFMLGCFFSKFSLFHFIGNCGNDIKKYKLLIASAIGGGSALAIRAFFPIVGLAELVAVPVFVISACFLGCVHTKVRALLIFFGRHSTNLWLIHSFFIFYYLKDITFLTSNTLIMYMTVVGCSIVCSIVLEKSKVLVRRCIRGLLKLSRNS